MNQNNQQPGNAERKTIREVFEHVGGYWTGDGAFPTFGSAEALRIYTVKMQRDAVQAALAAQPAEGRALVATGLWHAPGLGEVHSHDHKYMIDCQRDIDDPDHDYVADDKLAEKVCAALNAYERAAPERSDTPADTCAEMRALCSACGGTGEVHDITGEWRGSCDCAASKAPDAAAGLDKLDATRFRWLNEDHDNAEVRELARSLAKRLGTSSYFAITRDIDEAMARIDGDKQGAQGDGK